MEMRQWPAKSHGWRSIRARFAETDESVLRSAISRLLEEDIFQGDDNGYYFTNDGCNWAVTLLRKANASPKAGLARANPFGPSDAEFEWPVHNPHNRRWMIGTLFDVNVLKDNHLRAQTIAHMADVLADPHNYGMQRRGKESHLRYKRIYNKRYRLVWCPDRGEGLVDFTLFDTKDDPNYSG